MAPLFLLEKDDPRPLKMAQGSQLPLAPYSHIDLTDAHGKRIPLDAKRESSLIAGVALAIYAERLIGHELSSELEESLVRISISDTPRRPAALSHVFSDNLDRGDPRSELQGDETFRELAHVFVGHRPVFAWWFDAIPERTIIKLAYDEVMQHQRLSFEEQLRKGIGWKSELFHVRLNEIGGASSYHTEIVIPTELEVTACGLFGERYQFGSTGIPPTVNRARRIWNALRRRRYDPRDSHGCYIRQVRRSNTVHLYVPESSGRRVGVAWVKLRAPRPGFLAGALIASMVTSAVLWLYEYRVESIVMADRSDATVAGLLLVPAVMAAYLASSDEHAITAKILRPARSALWFNAALPFIAAIYFVTSSGTPSDEIARMHECWSWCRDISLILVGYFIVSAVCPRPHGRSQYFVKTRDDWRR